MNPILSFLFSLLLLTSLFSGSLNSNELATPEISLVTLDFPQQKELVLNFAGSNTLDLNVRLGWPSTDGSIPSGWSRDTEFDDRFIQVRDTNYLGPVNGGDLNHTHPETGGGHTPLGVAHDHNSLGGPDSGGLSDLSKTTGVTPTGLPAFSHSVSSTNADSPTATITYDSNSIDVNVNKAIPMSYRVIVIKPDDGLQSFPDGAISFLNDSTIPTGFSITDGNNSTPDLTDGRFLFAPDTGDDGNIFVGSDEHFHVDDTPHNHDDNPVTHGTFTAGRATASVNSLPPVVSLSRSFNHHSITLDVNQQGALDENSTIINGAGSEPDFIELLGVENTSGGDLSSFDEIVFIFVGFPSQIPTGYVQVTNAADKQIKITVNTNDINNTDGFNVRTHGTVPDRHSTDKVHTHDVNAQATITSNNGVSGFPASAVVSRLASHTHVWTIGVVNATAQDANVILDAVDQRYKFRDVILIRKLPPTNTCTYSGSGNFEISCADNCLLSSDVDLAGNKIVLINGGILGVNATLRRVGGIEFPADPLICEVQIYVLESGGVEFE